MTTHVRRIIALASIALLLVTACGGESEPDVNMSEIEPVVTDIVDRAVAQVTDQARPNGELGPRPCFSGPPVEDLGTTRLHYAFIIDVEPGTESGTAATVIEFLTDEGLDPLEAREAGRHTEQYFRGDGYTVGVTHLADSGVVSVSGSTECLDP